MKRRRAKRCPECGQGNIHPLAKAGRTTRYKSIDVLPIPDDLTIPTCDRCGSEWLDQATATAIDDALSHLAASISANL